jgi:hypothetical protein
VRALERVLGVVLQPVAGVQRVEVETQPVAGVQRVEVETHLVAAPIFRAAEHRVGVART